MAHVSDIFSASTGKAIESAIVAQKKSWWPLVGQLWRVLGAVFIYRRVSNSFKNLPPPPPCTLQPTNHCTTYTYNLFFLCVCKLFWFLEFYSTPFFFGAKLPLFGKLWTIDDFYKHNSKWFHQRVSHFRCINVFYSIFGQCSGSLSFDGRPPPHHTGGELTVGGSNQPQATRNYSSVTSNWFKFFFLEIFWIDFLFPFFSIKFGWKICISWI